jgi:gas vesicle protein
MTAKRTGAFVTGLFMGACVGSITGLLVAPRTGRETRRLLKQSADALPDLAEDLTVIIQSQTHRLSGTALRNWEGTLERLREAIAAGLEASQQAQGNQETETVSVPAYSYESQPLETFPPQESEH